MSESGASRELTLDFAAALGVEFVAYLEAECRHDLREAQYVVRACWQQPEAIFAWPEGDDE